MKMNQKSLTDLWSEVENQLRERGNCEGRIKQHYYAFKVFENYCKKISGNTYSEKAILQCIKDHYGVENFEQPFFNKSHYIGMVLRTYYMLRDVNNGEIIKARYKFVQSNLTIENFISCINNYRKLLYDYEYSNLTIKNYIRYSENFFIYCEKNSVTRFSDITVNTIQKYILSLINYCYTTKKNTLGGLRLFLKYLNDLDLIEKSIVDSINTPQSRTQTKIPSIWRKDEVICLLNAIDRGNPSGKRDYAMILIVARLGIRISDVKKLKFENFNWKLKQINFEQSKTKKHIILPLLNDIGWAVADYIKNGRPNVKIDYIFITHIAPYKEYAEDNHLYRTIEKYMSIAKLPISNKRRNGMHSLRHTLATRMLENKENIHHISAALGHSSIDSTTYYLKTSTELLRECALSPKGVIK